MLQLRSLHADFASVSSLHEIRHCVLPGLPGQIVVCSESDLSIRAARVQEREASARHLVESSLCPCLFAAYQRNDAPGPAAPSASVRYSLASPSFAQAYGTQLRDDDNEHVLEVWTTERDIADSITDDVMIGTANGETTPFHAEYFFNGYNAFCLLNA